MSKNKNSLFNLVFSLTVISSVAALVLAIVYSMTLDPIQKTNNEKKANALKNVLPAFDKTSELKVKPEDATDSLTLYFATKGNDTVGYALETYTDKGFSGHFTVMVGFNTKGEIVNTKVLEHKETPGLGSKMTDDKFKSQFNGKDPEKFKLMVKKDQGDVDAITASTITSRAFCDALTRAYSALKPFLKGGKQ